METAKTHIGEQAFAAFEPSLQMTFLPRCPGCEQPHPRTPRGGNLDSDICSNCGTTCPVGTTQDVPATIIGYSPSAIAARALLGAGRFLRNLAGRP